MLYSNFEIHLLVLFSNFETSLSTAFSAYYSIFLMLCFELRKAAWFYSSPYIYVSRLPF